MKIRNNQKGFSVVEILIVIVVIGLLVAVGWLVYDRQNSKSPETSNMQTNNSPLDKTPKQEITIADPYKSWKVYTNTKYGFELKYPENLKIITGSTEPSTDVHFQDSSGSVFGVIAEPLSGYCHISLCDLAAKSKQSLGGNSWDYLGQQTGSGYGLEGSNASASDVKGSFYYRTTYGQYRYYVAFDKESDQLTLIMNAFKFKAE